ncbi:hypothetical protein SAMN04489713_111111 [Actinomadura madurae]|uniref:DUF5666 domain-containing protein n=2 Tax=Actinomadura madurae TaxID=1993 RepID=A0A1I5M1A3_9ACTN|nr:hypothetical protein SAMN04489713_111111 [Actinomadura madurae]SPT52287.1 Uncharacterised protein [Actinomadura madurae]
MVNMRTNRKTIAATAGAAGLLGLGLYLAVPAAADDPSPSPKATTEWGHRGEGRPGWGHPGMGGHPFWRAGGMRGVHGEATVKRDGGFHLATWQRGDITSVSATAVTVRSEDGVSWTWKADDETRVRKDGDKSAMTDLKNGDQVLVAGERSGDTRTARFIRVPKPR